MYDEDEDGVQIIKEYITSFFKNQMENKFQITFIDEDTSDLYLRSFVRCPNRFTDVKWELHLRYKKAGNVPTEYGSQVEMLMEDDEKWLAVTKENMLWLLLFSVI